VRHLVLVVPNARERVIVVVGHIHDVIFVRRGRHLVVVDIVPGDRVHRYPF